VVEAAGEIEVGGPMCMMCAECTKGKPGYIGKFLPPKMDNPRATFLQDEEVLQNSYYSLKAPQYSIAAGYDFGRLTHLVKKNIPQPSMKDLMVVSKTRSYFVTVKVVANSKATQRTRLAGSCIAFPVFFVLF
jgi:hypothetical protein